MQQAPQTGWTSWVPSQGKGWPPPHTWPLPASTFLRETPGLGCWLDLCPGHVPVHLVFTTARWICWAECPGP